MEAFFSLILFLAGLLIIIKSGDLFVSEATNLARMTHIPRFIIGATVVSVATTLPELFVAAFASLQGETAFAVANTTGSAAANVGLILPIVLLFSKESRSAKEVNLQGAVLLSASLVLLLFSHSGLLLWQGVLFLLVLFAMNLYVSLQQARRVIAPTTVVSPPPERKTLLSVCARFSLGALGIAAGAKLLVDNGVLVAELLGIPSSVVALTMVSVGTSLPELVTALTALSKKESGISIGNLIGANVIDLTFILPVCSFFSQKEIPITDGAIRLDFPFCLILSALAVVPAMASGVFRRWQAFSLIASYLLYLTCSVFFS